MSTSELTESSAEPTGEPVEELSEQDLPGQGLEVESFTRTVQKDVQATRRKLAIGLLWLIAVLAVVPTVALAFGHWTKLKADAFREMSLIFTPVVALASAAFGFFFASDDRNRF